MDVNLLSDRDCDTSATVPVVGERVRKVPLSQYWVIVTVITVPLSQYWMIVTIITVPLSQCYYDIFVVCLVIVTRPLRIKKKESLCGTTSVLSSVCPLVTYFQRVNLWLDIY